MLLNKVSSLCRLNTYSESTLRNIGKISKNNLYILSQNSNEISALSNKYYSNIELFETSYNSIIFKQLHSKSIDD